MQNHVAGLVQRCIAPGRVFRSPAQRACRYQHLPGERRGISGRRAKTASTAACEHPNTDTNLHTDTPAFRQIVQEWREHGDSEAFVNSTPISHRPRTSAASRHRKRIQAAVNGQLTTRPSQLSHAQISLQELNRSEPYYIDALAPTDFTLVSNPVPTPFPPSLYQTLLHQVHTHTPLSSLLKYHSSQPSWKRTSKTYNLLISHAIRHASFSTVDTLVLLMNRDGIRPTLQTEKLTIRNWIMSGRWEWAWRTTVLKYNGVQNMPLVLWMEFLGGVKKGAVRRQWGSVVEEGEETLAIRAEKVFRTIPNLRQEERAEMPPRTVHAIVQLMLELGWKDKAETFTRHYLQHLNQLQLEDEHILDMCLKLIELHIVLPRPARPLRKSEFFEKRTLIMSFLATHPQLEPRSHTVYLLLSLLKNVKHPWTVSQSTIHLFHVKQGVDPIDDRKVQRRLAQLALKEGRVNVARRVVKKSEEYHYVAPTSIGAEARRKLRYDELFVGQGRENQKWKRLRRRVGDANE